MNEEDINNLNEIIELCEEEINNNDENVTAILDLADLKSLRNLITRNRELEALKNSCKEKINLKQLKIKDLAAENDYLKALLYCKDKKIDLMAVELQDYSDYFRRMRLDEIKQYFEKKVEEC